MRTTTRAKSDGVSNGIELPPATTAVLERNSNSPIPFWIGLSAGGIYHSKRNVCGCKMAADRACGTLLEAILVSLLQEVAVLPALSLWPAEQVGQQQDQEGGTPGREGGGKRLQGKVNPLDMACNGS